MHSTDIMYTDAFDRTREYPEAFTIHYNGDYSGDIVINLEGDRVECVATADSRWTRHGNAIYEVKIPFEVVAKLVAQAVVSAKVARLEDMDDNWRKVLDL